MSSVESKDFAWSPSAATSGPPDIWRVGGDCNAVSVSPDGTLAAVAGRDVLKIVQFHADRSGFAAASVRNLRTGRKNLLWSSNDVQWNPHESMKQLLCTAATNGKIVIYNLEKLTGGTGQQRIFDDHSRTVNRVGWHPIEVNLLLSGSQDGTMRLFDIREATSQALINADSGPVRDVQWTPQAKGPTTTPASGGIELSAWVFAAGFDSGAVQVWDIRSPSVPLYRISGHPGHPVLAIDWHLEKKGLLASAARDKTIKVWSLSPDDYNVTPKFQVQTMASLARIAWRPGVIQHLASAATVFDNRVHVWDISEPYFPAASFPGHSDVVTGMQWLDSSGSKLLTCSKDSSVRIFHFNRADFARQSIRTAAVCWNSKDELGIVFDSIDRSPPDSLLSSSSLIAPTVFLGGEVRLAKRRQGTSEAEQLEFLAKQYIQKPQNTEQEVEAACRYNSKIAEQAKKPEAALMWNAIAELFWTAPLESFSKSLPRIDSGDSIVGSTSGDIFSSSGAREGIIFGDSHEEEEYHHFHLSLTRASSGPRRIQSAGSLIDEALPSTDILPNIKDIGTWSLPGKVHELDMKSIRRNSIADMLKVCAESGDVQSCAVVLLVLDGLRKSEPIEMKSGKEAPPSMIFADAEQSREWFMSYINLLRSLELWSLATEVAGNCSDAAVRSMNQDSTIIPICCGGCGKPLESSNAAATCKHCTSQHSICAVCRHSVRGPFVWCQGCGHGGHIDHISQWFSKHPWCPAGCLHNCTKQDLVTS